MMKRYMTTGLIACLAGYAAGASAVEPTAVLRQPQGRVFVSQAATMGPAREGMPLYAGDRVIAVSGGRAEVAYPNGCVVALPENSLLAIRVSNQCRLSRDQVRAVAGFQNSRIGQAGPLPSGGSSDDVIADLKRPKKDVLLNETPAQNNMDARRDDQIATGQDSNVTVVFRGCEVDVGPGQQITVDELREQCKAGIFLASGEDSNAEVAIVKRLQGSVMVDKVAASNDMGVKSSTRIITGAGSKVTVIFKACEVVVDEKEDVKVRDLVTKCKGGFWADAGAGGVGVGAGVGAGVGVGVGAGVSAGAIVIGAGLGATLIGAILAGDDGASSRATP